MATSMTDLQVLQRGGRHEPTGVVIHPPARRWKTRVLLPAGIILAVLLLLGYAARESLLPARSVQVIPVVLREASADASAVSLGSVQAPGWVEADPFSVGASALADGVIREVLVLDGQAVQAGQTIARLIDDDARIALARAKAERSAMEAEQAVAQARLNAAKADWENPVERQRAVRVAEAALDGARADLIRHEHEIVVEEARFTEINEKLPRIEATFARSASSDLEIIEIRAQHQAQKAMVDSARQQHEVLKHKITELEAELAASRENARLRIEEKQTLDEAEAMLALANAKLLQAQAEVEEAQLALTRMEVKSPIDGVVLSLKKSPGQTVNSGMDDPSGMEIARLYDPKSLQVRVDIPLADAGKVSVGQKAQIVVGVLPDRTFTGEVTRLVHEADIQRNTMQVKVRIDNPPAALKPEMLARVKFMEPAGPGGPAGGQPGGPSGDAQTVFAPRDRLLHLKDGRAHVWIVDRARSVAAMREVTIGRTQIDGWVAVVDGLRAGDQLIAGDTSTLADGQRLRIIETEASHGAH